MRKFIFLVILISLSSCMNSKKIDVESFKIGKFKTVLDANEDVSFAVRNDSIQIETHDSKEYEYSINWVNNFEYVLKKINPKTTLDNTPFHVKITGIKENSYTFVANYKGSNFKQKGTVIKISD